MTKKNGIIIILCSLLMLAVPLSVASQGQVKKEKIVGTVVAYIYNLAGHLSTMGGLQEFIVRVEKRNGNQIEKSYIKVNYGYFAKYTLPDEMFKKAGRWKFLLSRNPDCDEALGKLRELKSESESTDFSSGLLRIAGAEKEELPKNVILPCYMLENGGFTKARK